jgi:ferredoxin-NADP reductase
VVVAPEFFRQYSLAGDPADPGRYQIAVLREDQGKGGSALIHRIFRPGRRVFISRPINHFPLAEDAAFSLLLGGGIGVTPLIAMAHRLHALGRSFALHYAIRSRQSAGFLADLEAVPWKEEVHLYVSDEGGRADLDAVIGDFHPSAHLPDVQLRDVHLYVCGPDRLMQAARETAMRKGWPEAQVHVEYFAAPEQGERVDHPFKLALARTGRAQRHRRARRERHPRRYQVQRRHLRRLRLPPPGRRGRTPGLRPRRARAAGEDHPLQLARGQARGRDRGRSLRLRAAE